MKKCSVLGIKVPAGFTVSDAVKVIDDAGVSSSAAEVKETVLARERDRRVEVSNARRKQTRLGNRVRSERELLNQEPTTWAPTVKPYRRGRD